MGLLSRLLDLTGKKKSSAAASAAPVPSAAPSPSRASASTSVNTATRQGTSVAAPAPTGIRYDANLVPSLKEDHAHLLELYTRIHRDAEAGHYARVHAGLGELKLAFQTHIMVENVKFYVYLQQQLGNDAQIAQFLADIRREMDGIARGLVSFLRDYDSPQAIEADAQGFGEKYSEIGRVLTRRIELEESRLYTLYVPSY